MCFYFFGYSPRSHRPSALEKEIRTAEKQIEHLKQKELDFSELCRAYEEYQEHCRQQEKCRKEELRLTEGKKLSKLKEGKLQEKLLTLRNQQADLEREQERLNGQLSLYQAYREAVDGEGRAEVLALPPEIFGSNRQI